MAQCSRNVCRRWRPDLAVSLAGLGLLVDGAWFCSRACVEAEAAAKLEQVRTRQRTSRPVPRRLGTVLMQRRTVTAQQLGHALEAQRSTGLRLGAQLQRMGFASRDDVLLALSAQHGVSYLASIDLGTVRTAPGRLTADEVRALGVIPFRETPEALMVACAAPLPQAALDALGVLSGRTIQPFLVADDDFERLNESYCDASTRRPQAPAFDSALEDAGLVAVSDAATPTASRDPFTWVRIAADGHISTLLLPASQQQKEHDSWLAATTPH